MVQVTRSEASALNTWDIQTSKCCKKQVTTLFVYRVNKRITEVYSKDKSFVRYYIKKRLL